MTAGMRMQVTIHSIGQGPDDEVGGAIYTGTATLLSIPATIQYLTPSRLLLEQGTEVKRIAKILVQPGSLVIVEQDEVEVVGPPGHEDVGRLFKVVSVDRTGFSPNDTRGRFLQLTCERLQEHRDTRFGFQ
jgi:hypothetical protein